MKIIIIGTAFPYRGGLSAFNERLARQFSSEGHDVLIITFKLQYPSFLFPGKTQFQKGPPPEGLSIIRMVNSVNPFSWIGTGCKIKKEKPDIVIFKYWLPFMAPCFGTIARIVHSNRRTKVICIFDNVIPHEKRAGDKLLTRYFINSIQGALVMSEPVLNDLLKFGKEIPVNLNPHPLFDNFGQPVMKDEAIAKLNLSHAYSYILFFGFVREYKGLDLLLKAFPAIKIVHKNVKLIIAGEFYDDEKSYMQLIREENLTDDVHIFNRFIDDNEVAYFFCAADLVVQPYKSATQSGVTQIAYHFDKPMVVTDVGGLKEIVQDGVCGFVVKPDPAEIANAVIKFFSGSYYETFIENIREEKKKYSWGRFTNSILDIYNKIKEDDNQK